MAGDDPPDVRELAAARSPARARALRQLAAPFLEFGGALWTLRVLGFWASMAFMDWRFWIWRGLAEKIRR
eukprot:11184763-Lingulodinium_polyedra.AAC.1